MTMVVMLWGWVKVLRKYRLYILLGMVVAALLNAFARFWGEWKYFFGVLIAHLIFWQAVQSYLYGKNIFLGVGVVKEEDSKGLRLSACFVALAGYSFVFLFDGYPWG
ncbi:hypothetical protein [Halomonas heilongjiangensis]|uniref:hypothetical protein n=1 Tax=Halomonas heilongjiangensis TaxID=1387883 RepID=UPI0011AF4062|nr:hypothetical protein [Halomonas heilongjiangensis]